MFWIIALGVPLILVFSMFLRTRRLQGQDLSRHHSQPSAAYDLQVYRDQLREVDHDIARGVLQPEDAQRLRTEIGRKVLDADRRLTNAPPVPVSQGAFWPVAILTVCLGAGVGLYAAMGQSHLPDQPLAARIAAADMAFRSRPHQDQAQAEAPPLPRPDLSAVDPSYLALLEALRARLQAHPDDIKGLELLAHHELELGNIQAAHEALSHLVDLRKDQAPAEDLAKLALLMAERAGDLVTPEAEAMLERALARDPNMPQALYLKGVMYLQNGRPDLAFPLWNKLLELGPSDAPWMAMFRPNITELAWLAGYPNFELPDASPALPGPSPKDVANAATLSATDQQQMINTMVTGLEQRLLDQGGSAEEWVRLLTSMMVLGDTSKATQILARARQEFAASPDDLATINRAAQQAGIPE